MEEIINNYGGDLDEYKRLSRYIAYIFGNDSFSQPFTQGHMVVYDDNPVLYLPWHRANTKEKRAKFLHEVISSPCNSTYGNKTCYPPQYLLALYEDEINDVYSLAACVIQRHIRGIITRNKFGVYNPHCEIGKKFLTRMFLEVF